MDTLIHPVNGKEILKMKIFCNLPNNELVIEEMLFSGPKSLISKILLLFIPYTDLLTEAYMKFPRYGGVKIIFTQGKHCTLSYNF